MLSTGELTWDPDGPVPADEPTPDRFLRLVCLTYSESDSPQRRADAATLLAGNRGLASDNVFVAAAVADAEAVAAMVAARPGLARATGGPYNWSPLLYLAYGRPQPAPSAAATLSAARTLVDAGADPNDGRYWRGLNPPFTVLTGVFGGGERDQPVHPHAQQLARLLLTAGADANDGQTLYNRMFGTDDSHLVLLLEFGLGRGPGGPWHRRSGSSLDPPQAMVRALLDWAVTHDQRERVRLLAANGIDITAPASSPWSGATRGHTPIETALLNGHTDLVALLEDLGAHPPRLSAAQRFVAAALAGDVAAVRRAAPRTVAAARRARSGLVVWAAALNRPAAVRLLVETGFDVNARGRGDTTVEQGWETALHVAAGNGNLDLARVLLALGADPSVTDLRFGGTPLDWARTFDRPELVSLLEPLTG